MTGPAWRRGARVVPVPRKDLTPIYTICILVPRARAVGPGATAQFIRCSACVCTCCRSCDGRALMYTCAAAFSSERAGAVAAAHTAVCAVSPTADAF